MIFDNNKKLEKIEFPKNIKICNCNYDVKVFFLKKKSSSVSFKEEKIIFRMSSYLTLNQAKKDFDLLLKKISKKLYNKPVSQNVDFYNVLEKGFFNFSNELYYIKYKNIRSIKLLDNVFYVNPKIKKENIEKAIIKLLIYKYEPRIIKYVKQINRETFNFKIGYIKLKSVKSKWGHCTTNNDIMLNLKLLNASTEILNYVVIHELAHVKHKNHSKQFWNEVIKYCPNYKQIRKKIRINPPMLYCKND